MALVTMILYLTKTISWKSIIKVYIMIYFGEKYIYIICFSNQRRFMENIEDCSNKHQRKREEIMVSRWFRWQILVQQDVQNIPEHSINYA